MKKILLRILDIDLGIAVICLAALTYIVFSNVIFRYLFNAPYQWGEEVEMMLMVWIIWYGGSAVFRHSSQVCVDMIVTLFPKKIQQLIATVMFLLSVMILIFLAVQGFSYISQLARTNRVTESLHISKALIYSCMPIGCIWMTVSAVISYLREMALLKEGL